MVSTNSAGAAVVEVARTQLGTLPYKWGTPRPITVKQPKSADCSGFVAWVYYQALGVKLTPQTGIMYTQMKHRTLKNAQPGDAVFFGGSGRASTHMGIFIGNGQMINAVQDGTPVSISTIARNPESVVPLVGICPTPKGGIVASTGGGGTASNGDAIIAFFHKAFPKLSTGALAGIEGNSYIESKDDPTAYNPRENAHNIFQDEGGRWSGPNGLQAYAKAHGQAPDSLAAGLGYAEYELTHGKGFVLDELLHATSAADAAAIWRKDFEGADPSSTQARIDAANQTYSRLTAGQPVGHGPTSAEAATFTGGAGKNNASSAPYDPATLKPPLTKAQRTAILGWLFVQSLDVDGIPAPDVLAKMPDAELITEYAAIFKLQSVLGSPITGPGDAISSAIHDVEQWVTGLGKYVLDGFVVLVGVIMVILAFVLIAKSTGTDLSINNGSGKPGPAPAPAAAPEAAAE